MTIVESMDKKVRLAVKINCKVSNLALELCSWKAIAKFNESVYEAVSIYANSWADSAGDSNNGNQ